ncbi:adhesin, partial [Mesomycoplasma ovipneumoniae]|nr:adhesin [Mesomycoplasma ovipneumoniae]
ILERNYDLDFGPYISLLDSWVGKLKHPSLSDIKRMTKDETQSTRNAGVSSIESRNFFRDGHQVASYFQDLLTKDRKVFLETLFELTKKWGLIDESTQLPQSLLDSKDNIFEEANKISLTPTGDIKKLSFNTLWRDNEGIGFYGTLVLPTSVQTELKSKKGDSAIFEYLKTQKVTSEKPSESTNNEQDFAKFEKFGDVLSAFFLKAGQFDNFKSWAKLDDNLKYTLEFTKEAEQEKDEVSKKIEELSKAEEPKAEGAQDQGKKAEGAQNQGKKEQVLPVKFSFKLESNDGSILNVKTPDVKVFLELEDDDIYKNRKEINELDSAVIKLQSQFRETSLDSDSYSNLTFPKKTEGTQNQGKKAEGAQNQGKKAEGAQNQTDQNSLKSYLPELGKKVDEYLETHFKDKNYKTLVESISDSFGKTTKDLFFVLVKDETSSGSGSSGSSTVSPQKRSTLRVKITISESKTATSTTSTTSGTVSSSS